MLKGMSSASEPSQSTSRIRIPSLKPGSSDQAPSGTLSQLIDFLDGQTNLLVLTGAGLSTTSGIPAYRDASGVWLRRTPIFYQDFLRSSMARRRYWARSYFGWPHIAKATPNLGHFGLTQLQQVGRIGRLITQNVDGLHASAGSQDVIELHGQLGRVSCLDCGQQYQRSEVQQWLTELNGDFSADVLRHNPDGDVDLDEMAYPDFKIADCKACGGRLKPDVVFFGESVPDETATHVKHAIDACSGLLVIGSSLVVMSGYRVVKDVIGQQKPAVAINQGRTRADNDLAFKVSGDCCELIEALSSSVITQGR